MKSSAICGAFLVRSVFIKFSYTIRCADKVFSQLHLQFYIFCLQGEPQYVR